ncbi:putative T7SS-secreted protein [Streptomyces sp. NPDC005573]|uniref:putative T7SS-secreted protein n=1 Tax=Streptomyces sp. NPDC005573 TaxID=3156890 RepID=UPI0033ACC51F
MGILGSIGHGLEDGTNWALGKGEKLLDDGKKAAGEGIDWGAHQIGDGLDKVGLHDAADKVDDWGDEIASDLGATPGEQQLGESDDPKDLVHGDHGQIVETAKHLTDFSTAFEKVSSGLKRVDSSGWKGEGGDAFRDKLGMHPARWLHAADACQTASGALQSYAETVKWAQGQAKDAIALYEKGKHTSEAAVTAYNKRIDAYNAKIKADEDPGPEPEAFHDPGKSDIAAAREKLGEARKQRNTAAATANAKVKEALAHAPAEPPPLDRLGNDFVDYNVAASTELTHVVGGVVKGAAGLVNFVRGLDPMDPYNITHPAEYVQGVSTTLSGLVSTAAHPERMVKAVVDGFEKDPSEFVGRLIPQLIGTDGAGLAAGGLRTAAEEGVELTAANMAKGGLEHAAEGGAGEAAEASKWSHLARSTDHVSEEAIHYDSVSPEVAQQFLDDQYPWLKDVNNRWEDGYTQNCGYTTVTVNGRLDGIEASAARREGPGTLPLEPLGVKDPATAWHKVDSYDDIIRDLKDRGEGARSAVYIGRGQSGHFFNAVNTEHGVVFLDGQSGQLGQLERGAQEIMHVPYGKGAP